MNSGRIAFNPAKPALLVLLLVTLCCSFAEAQSDSTFSVLRNGIEAKFPFTKFARPDQFRTVASSALPLYGFNKAQFIRIRSLLTNFAQMENDYQKLVLNHHEKDSLLAIKEKTLTQNVKLEEERAINFQTSYNSLLGINAQLNDQVKNAEQLAIHEHKKRKLNSILLGVLAFSAGVVIGVTVR